MFDWIQSMDITILNFIAHLPHNGFTDILMLFFTYIGEAGLIWIALILILIASKKYRLIGILSLLSLIMALILGEGILKHLIQRPRPFLTDDSILLILKEPNTYSFPSGHTGSSFAVAGVLFTQLKHLKVKWIALILALLISFSRLYLMVHYPSDILVGMALGLLCAFIVVKYMKKPLASKIKHSI